MKEGFSDRIRMCADNIRQKSSGKPSLGIILGSGLNDVVDSFEGDTIPYNEIDGFPRSTVSGHRGFLRINGDAAVFAGRFHFYEGWDMDDVVLPCFVMHELGVETLIITNAAGGVNTEYKPGDLILIRDHINFMGRNPLMGPNDDSLGPRFPDMTKAYDPGLMTLADKANGSPMKRGVYCGFSGPSYETPAEITMAKAIGADLVGMSTVPEVIAAGYLGMKVLGISCVTNMAAGILDQPLSHEEVIETGKQVKEDFSSLILSIARNILKS